MSQQFNEIGPRVTDNYELFVLSSSCSDTAKQKERDHTKDTGTNASLRLEKNTWLLFIFLVFFFLLFVLFG